VVVDPGHNGANASHPAQVNRPIPNGRDGTKACDTTGTSTDRGYPEHAFNWDVALRVRDALTARGVRVVLTRPDDAGVGPCVNDRAAIANRVGAVALGEAEARETVDPWVGQIARASSSNAAITCKIGASSTPSS
jgi:N-acetylmuramoyl-L-alanine amidase